MVISFFSGGPGAAAGPGGDAPVGRGAMRGRRQLPTEILRTKPEQIDSKKGTFSVPLLCRK